MKIAYSHLAKFFKKPPTMDKLSKSLFQLGHEHEIANEIFDMIENNRVLQFTNTDDYANKHIYRQT